MFSGGEYSIGVEVEGVVSHIDNSGVYVDLDVPLEALLPLSEEGACDLEAGDEVDGLYVVAVDGCTGRMILGTSPPAAGSTRPEPPAALPNRPLVPLPSPTRRPQAADAEALAEAERWRRPARATSATQPRRYRPVPETFRRGIQALLERLDPASLQPISEQFARIPITTAGELSHIAGAVLHTMLSTSDVCCKEVWVTLVSNLQGAWVSIPLVLADQLQTFSACLFEACRRELWEPRGAIQNSPSSKRDALAKRPQLRALIHVHFLGLLTLHGILPAEVITVVVPDLLLGIENTGALPGESDVERACLLLMLAGGELKRTHGGDGQLSQICQRMAQLQRARRKNGAAVNPSVPVYGERIRNFVQDCLHEVRAGCDRGAQLAVAYLASTGSEEAAAGQPEVSWD